MADVNKLVFSIIRFLQDQKTNNSLDEDKVESIEVAIQCLESAYDINTSDEQTVNKYQVQRNLLDIFNAQLGVDADSDFSTLSLHEATPEEKEEAEKMKNKGNDFMKEEKFSDALKCYSDALRLDNKNSVYYCNRAAAYSKLSEHMLAIGDCEKALRIDPLYSKAYGRMGIAYTALEDHESAIECYRKALELDPGNQSYQNNLEISEQKLQELAARSGLNMGPMGGMPDISSLLNNPAMMNMAQNMMTNPDMQQMMANIMSGASQSGEGGIGSLLQVGQQLAQQMQQQNPELVEQLRAQMGRPPSSENPSQQPPNPPGVSREIVNMSRLKVGIIGGSGLSNTEIFEDKTEKSVETPFGKPSDALIIGKIHGVDCVLLSRHGRGHTIMPSNVNYRANIWALKEEGCTHVLVTTACGSLQEGIHPGDMVVLDQFIDRTQRRIQTFYDGSKEAPKGICHIPLAEPFCPRTSEIIFNCAKELGHSCRQGGTMLTIEGPRFSSKAESKLWNSWGAHCVNMTTVPEVILAKEAGLCYAAMGLVTDYDSWREDTEGVNVENVLKTFAENSSRARAVILNVIPKLKEIDWTDTLKANQDLVKGAVMLPHSY